MQAWYASIPTRDQPSFFSLPYKEVTKLGDSLVPLLAPHYPADEITRLFLPETYPTPLLPVPPPPPTEPLFLPDFVLSVPPLLSDAAPPVPSKSSRSHKSKDLVTIPKSPPPGSLAAELKAEAAHRATAKEREAAQLDELIRNNTDPGGRGRHLSSKEKKAAQASTGKFPVVFPCSSSAYLPHPPPAVETEHLEKTPDGFAIWPPPPGAANAPQRRNSVSLLPSSAPSSLTTPP